MLSIFEFSNYRAYLPKKFEEFPKGGYGQSRRLAEYLGVHTTLVSQVFKGHKSFTPEQAQAVCHFLGLREEEEEYFLELVMHDRAGTKNLKTFHQKRIEKLKAENAKIINRSKPKKVLSEEDKAIFYSDWSYSAVRQMTAIPGFETAEVIRGRLGISAKRMREIVDFLLRANLILEEGGKLRIGPQSTHIPADSPWVKTFHLIWRQKAISALNSEAENSLNYTCPLTIGVSDVPLVQELLLQTIEKINSIVDPSPSEELRCLNIDWFRL